jgi:hypothetical protein
MNFVGVSCGIMLLVLSIWYISDKNCCNCCLKYRKKGKNNA